MAKKDIDAALDILLSESSEKQGTPLWHEPYTKMLQLAEITAQAERLPGYAGKIGSIVEKAVVARLSESGISIRALQAATRQLNSAAPVLELDLYTRALRVQAFSSLEAFIKYMERLRPYEQRFYEPRQIALGAVAERLNNFYLTPVKKWRFLGLSMPPRVGKSTMCIFFMAWIALRNPNSHSAMGGHSGVLASGFYEELLNLFTTTEYTFDELYTFWHPEYAKQSLITDKSAEFHTITLGNPDRFGTITCRGIDGTWTGDIDISPDGILYVDDLVRDREHALSPIRMEKTYQEYQNKMLDRMNDGTKILMVGTLWNVMDPLERERVRFEKDTRYRFMRIPALDPVTDESNFQYEVKGYSTDFYREMRARLDDADWQAKYQQRPYTREGLLFPRDELRYFNGTFPEDGRYPVIAVIDTAFGGGDFLSMPIARQFPNNDLYIFAWVFSAAGKLITEPKVVQAIKTHGIMQVTVEADNGGDMYKDDIDRMLKEQGIRCTLNTRRANKSIDKHHNIIQYSAEIMTRCVFLQEGAKPAEEETAVPDEGMLPRYYRNAEYQAAMDQLESYVSVGRNPHDDAPDSLTMLIKETNPERRNRALAAVNPFVGMGWQEKLLYEMRGR